MTVVPGIPADYDDFIVSRRIRIVSDFPEFTGSNYRLLDAGCGSGCTILKVHDLFGECHGLDVNHNYVEQLQHQISARGLSNCSASTGDLCAIEIESNSIDRLISFEVIEHLPDESRGLKEMYRVLKPGGLAAFSVPNKWWIFETHGAYLPILPWHRVPFFSWLPKSIHERFAKARIYTKRAIRRSLVAAGFQVQTMSYVTAPMDRLTYRPLQSFVKQTIFRSDTTQIPFLSTSIMVLAEK